MSYLRTLLGAPKEKLVHDPGEKGPEGEGEAAMTMLCLTYFATVGILIYEKFLKKKGESNEMVDVKTFAADAAAKAVVDGKTDANEGLTEDEIRDKISQEMWTQPAQDGTTPEFRAKFIKAASFGAITVDSTGPVRDALYFLSGVNYLKIFLIIFVFFNIWVFLLVLSIMGTSFKLLGGKDSAKMFDVVDNPISGVMIGILATVLVQSSSTTTSIIISLVGANELSVRNAVFMIMGANIGTSVTNTIVAMGHFANKDDLRRGFAAATVHDVFNLLCVAVFLPLNWIYPFFEKMTYEMAKKQTACEEGCVKREFLKPYISPYSKGVANYDKKVSGYISKGYCGGECGKSYTSTQMKALQKHICTNDGNDCSKIHKNFEGSWVAEGYLYKKRAPAYITTDAEGSATAGFSYTWPSGFASDYEAKDYFDVNGTATTGTLEPNTMYEVCGSKVKTGLCNKRLLKGGIALTDWKMTDDGAGALLAILALAGLCSCLFCIVYSLQIVIKGAAARVLQRVVGFNGYFNILVGMGITIMVQSSSITTATLTPIAAVGLIGLEDMLPLTLGANIGTTLTGIMGATVVASNPVEAWQVALCHLFFNIFGILLWYPIPKMRRVPLNAARFLGRMTTHPKFGKVFPLIYTFVVFFIIPGICYGIAVAATQ
eukprot:CAMPEP_0181377354 /NCGR_PEP_ID=MMETSP1106-20121128/17853_1 /TAXON_ID=81844 /ORGANISM="Mantoniella antarctica, Strain SL-175" /LENGTH=657 /DNA_ID=CAMNT_0023496085 /DNA_START=55 /DNA_END=2028 /DNA_ORIENTATION=+